jgi:hypothetical protein
MKPKLEASETLEALLCDPKGNIVIHGSAEDKRSLRIAIDQVKSLERRRDKWLGNL